MAAYTEMNEDDILAAYKVKYEADILLTKCQLHTLLSNLQPELVLTLGSGRDVTLHTSISRSMVMIRNIVQTLTL